MISKCMRLGYPHKSSPSDFCSLHGISDRRQDPAIYLDQLLPRFIPTLSTSKVSQVSSPFQRSQPGAPPKDDMNFIPRMLYQAV